jgi:hypothetical protein
MNDAGLADEIEDWARAIAGLHEVLVRDAADARAAGRAAGMLWSGLAYQGAPVAVQHMLVQAIEAGYAAALGDIRSGSLDDEIRTWRPGLAGG